MSSRSSSHGIDVEARARAWALPLVGVVERAAHAGHDRPLREQEALLDGAPERRAVEDRLAVVAVVRVAVRVEQDEREGPVHRGVRAQLAEHDRVVAAEHDRRDPGAQDGLELRRDLGDRARGVARAWLEVAAVDDRLRREDVDPRFGLYGPQQRRAAPDRLGAEAGADAEARAGVERDPDAATSTPSSRARAGSGRTCGGRCSGARGRRRRGRSGEASLT